MSLDSSDRSGGLSRRSFLATSAGAGLGLGFFPQLLSGLPAPGDDAPCQSVIQIFLAGGLSHIDSWDPKPYAPVEYRGEYRTAKTKLTGEVFSEVLARSGQVADLITVIRSMTHSEAAHERGTHNMLTGYRPSPAVRYPSIGAVVSHELGIRNFLPAYVSIPNASNIYLGTGYLSSAHAPFTPGANPNSKGFRVRDLSPPSGVDRARVARRRKILEGLDPKQANEADAVEATRRFYEQAYALIESKPAREAFNLAAEKEALRNAYGRTTIGQGLLLARRLAGAGVRYLTVLDGGYDNHQRIFPTLRARLGAFDRAFAALIRDLEQREMLDSTMVVVTSEFGRTPRVNTNAGRDHWPRVFSIVMAGGGIQRGCIYGSSNDVGSEPENDPIGPADMAATIFHQLGIDPTAKLISPGGRPVAIVRDGRVLKEILG